MNFTILTLFPEFIEQGLHTSILGKACEKGLLSFNAVNIRDYSNDKNKRVDDYTYGGGAGMLMQAQPVFDAYNDVCRNPETSSKVTSRPRTIYVTPQGKPFTQKIAAELATEKSLVFLCGHYEGIDERVLDTIVTDRYSIGDYVLTGGELPALVMIDAISRLIPGVLGNDTSADIESFYGNLLEYPQYTRPEIWNGMRIPDVLLDGNPVKVASWRLEKSKELTKKVRPDLYEKYECTEKVKKFLLKDKRNNIHIIEALKRGLGDVVSLNPLVIYIPSECMAYITQDESGAAYSFEIFDEIFSELNITHIVTDDISANIFIESGKFEDRFKVRNSVYTEKVHKKICNKNIKKCTESDITYICENYDLCDKEYMQDRISRGLLYGIYEDDTLAGFAGVHMDGSIGMLFIADQYRRKGYGTDLINYIINLELDKGHTPYGQIMVHNNASFAMQDNDGLYAGDKILHYIYKK